MSEAIPHPVPDTVSVLIVDDEAGARETLSDIFSGMGYVADTAETGREAVAKVRERYYNLALLDVQLPDTTGTDLLAELKELSADTVCIMATGHASMETSIDALNRGAYAYITKPLDIAQINTIFRQALEKQRLERENRQLFAELSALSRLTDTALSTLELDQLLSRLLTSVTGYMRAEAGAILLLDENDELVLRSSIGLARRAQAQGTRISEHGFAGTVAAARKPVVMHAPELWDQEGGFDFRARSIQSTLGVPLESREQLIGVAHVDSADRREFSPDEIRLIQVLADRAAVVIDNARLFARERDLRERAAVLAEQALTLRDVAQALVGSVSLAERLEKLSDHFVRVSGARRCVIFLREGDHLIPQAVKGLSPRLHRWLLRQRVDLEEAGPTLRRLLAEGAPAAVHGADAEALATPSMARRWDVQSVLLVPLQYQGRVTGVVALDTPGVRREYTDDQLKMVHALAYQATIAIETGKTYEAERNIARTLQESFLSRETPVPHFDVASRYEPASQVAQIGGDYFDFIELDPGRLGIVMGDVCGKGLTAAVYTAMAKYMLRAYAMEEFSPASVLARLNRVLYSQMSDECMFITLVYGILDLNRGGFAYANAAHPPPLLYRSVEDRFEELSTTGGMVGAVPDMDYAEASVRIERDDVLALFTDGVTEARSAGEMLETEGVREVIRATARGSARNIADAIYNRAVDISSGQLKDDLAIVVIRAREPAGD